VTSPEADSALDGAPPGFARIAFIALGPGVFAAVLSLPPPAGLEPVGWHVTAVVGWMAVWWVSQAIPLAATALLPAILFPVLGAGSVGAVTSAYAHPLIFLFFGGFVVALTIERWNLHRRIALAVLSRAGAGPGALTGGFMLVTAVLSMWVSNTATTLMMVPIAVSVIALVEANLGEAGEPRAHARFASGLLIGVAYAASIGGLATLIGTPPNAFLAGYLARVHGIEVGFGQWMLIGLPVSLFMLGIAWFLNARVVFSCGALSLGGARQALAAQRVALGRMSRGERLSAWLLVAVATAWILRPVFDSWLPVGDTEIALAAALAAFVTPVDIRRGVFLMNWEHAARLPWGILILFGGGLSLAAAIDSTGLAAWIGGRLSDLGTLPVLGTILVLTLVVVFLTEISSNTATAAIFVPIGASFGATLGLPVEVLAVPVALAASCAFMMPVATPPNAIVFGSGHVSVMQMCRAGFLLNLVGSAVIAVAAIVLVPWIFGT
jgi:sodium-dependent dicarboxylate transporter 2/3/5